MLLLLLRLLEWQRQRAGAETGDETVNDPHGSVIRILTMMLVLILALVTMFRFLPFLVGIGIGIGIRRQYEQGDARQHKPRKGRP